MTSIAPSPFEEVAGVRVPRLLYGTAWKEEDTQRLTELALQTGFRGIDTANQRRHYHEAAVGEAIAVSIERGVAKMTDLFLQTKFTFRSGQDHRLPYDASAPISVQVEQSLSSSLAHLGTDVVDSYLLHGPSRRVGLAPEDWEAWRAIEAVAGSGRARLIGVSNVTLDQLQSLHRDARVKPRIVQNRCYASTGWDREVRRFCAASEIIYQGFSLLTANREVLAHPAMSRIARQHGKSVSQIVFRFAIDAGMIALTGTTSQEHMRQDLAIFDFRLADDDVAKIERLVA
jgi:diketogulonate reductase-like aldo/keto reductase